MLFFLSVIKDDYKTEKKPLGAQVQSGAHDQDRTDDLVLTKDVLYQLSYMGSQILNVILML